MTNEKFYFTEIEQESDEHDRFYAGEELTFNVTEDILIFMEDNGITKNNLAKQMGKSRAYISQLLSGSRNMTLRTLSDICHAIGATPSIEIIEKNNKNINYYEQFFTFTSVDQPSYVAEELWGFEIPCSEDIEFHSNNIIQKKDKKFWEKAA